VKPIHPELITNRAIVLAGGVALLVYLFAGLDGAKEHPLAIADYGGWCRFSRYSQSWCS